MRPEELHFQEAILAAPPAERSIWSSYMVVHASNPSTPEAGEFQVQTHPGQLSNLQDLGDVEGTGDVALWKGPGFNL